jgi:hypothetical protein
MLTSEVVLDIDVLGTLVVDRVIGKVDGTFVVDVDVHRVIHAETNLRKK